MTKKEICLSNLSFAYYSGFGGLEVKFIEDGINDYLYCVSGAWSAKKHYHKLKSMVLMTAPISGYMVIGAFYMTSFV